MDLHQSKAIFELSLFQTGGPIYNRRECECPGVIGCVEFSEWVLARSSGLHVDIARLADASFISQVTSKETGFQCFQEQSTRYTPSHDQQVEWKIDANNILGDV